MELSGRWNSADLGRTHGARPSQGVPSEAMMGTTTAPGQWSPRHRRLFADLDQMNELADRVSTVSFRAEGNPPETYHVLLNAPGIARGDDDFLRIRSIHRCVVYLHSEYPRRPPVITWLTPIVHPNILPPDRNGGVCLGSWSASESLADVIRRLIDLVSYRAFNVEDPLDNAAAAWVREMGLRPGSSLDAAIGHTTSSGTGEVAVSLLGAVD